MFALLHSCRIFLYGTSTYNNYTIAVSTENKETVNESDLYFVNSQGGNISGTYHRVWCEHLEANTGIISGYNKREIDSNESLKGVSPCYYCVVRASNASIQYAENYKNKDGYNFDKRKAAYYTALANEKAKLVKPSSFVNDNIQ